MRINQMPTVYFKGRVLPAPVQISFTDIPQVENWVWQEAGMTLEFVIRITNSQVEVECKLDRYQNDYMGEIHRRAFDLARACVNVAAFSTGLGVIVFFDEFIGPVGVSHPLVLASPHVVAECTAFKMNPVTLEEKKNLGAILALVMLEPAIFMALNDLIQAISTPHMAPANCGRVLDGLRKLVAPDMDPKQGWPIFQKVINVDEPYLTFISEHSKEPRHGGHIRIDGPTTMEISRRTWAIMNRFLEFRKRGNLPLPVAEFPILNG
jgi:hypothetical protein